jgi:hypothetical protein
MDDEHEKAVFNDKSANYGFIMASEPAEYSVPACLLLLAMM